MWNILNGTIINALAVAGGCAVGLLAGHRLPERIQRIILDVLGLITITLGIDAGVLGMSTMVQTNMPAGDAGKTYGAMLGLVMVASLIIGSIAGTLMRWHEGIERLGEKIHERFATGDGKTFAEGFLTASVIFCVGPLTMLGCLKNGAAGDPSYLYIKSLLDGFCSIALTASLGVGVAFSILTVVVFQGGLAVTAYYCARSASAVVGGHDERRGRCAAAGDGADDSGHQADTGGQHAAGDFRCASPHLDCRADQTWTADYEPVGGLRKGYLLPIGRG
ncbi:MAG: DUF554 domain-containing protein [Phycisphaerae bacterium]